MGCKGVFVTQTCFRDADDLKSTQFAGEVMRPPETTYYTGAVLLGLLFSIIGFGGCCWQYFTR